MTTVKKLLLLLAALAPVLMAAPCDAGVLRGEVLLEKDVITVADIFGDVGAAGSKVVGPAPAPGQKITYDVMALAQVAKNFSVSWQPESNYERVTLTRNSKTITAAMIKDRVAAEIAATSSEKELDIALDNVNLAIHRPVSEDLDWRIADLSYDAVARRFSGTLIIDSAKDSAAAVTPIGGRAVPMVKVAMLNRALQTGNRFCDSCVDWQPMPVDKAGADAITMPDQLKGLEARRNLEAKSVLRLRDTAKARLVTKGSMVTMQVVTPILQISAQGRALSDAVMGETVRVMNTQSNRAIDAIVTGEGKVSVTPSSASHIALAN